MNRGWYKGVNPRLDRLTSILGSSKPSHGYTISEKGPEIVTAPGVYFPAERGEVIPMRPNKDGAFETRSKGGSVEPPLHSDNERAKLEMVHKIIGHMHPAGLEHHAIRGLAVQPESMKIEQSKYDILKSALSLLKPPAQPKGEGGEKRPVKITPRQNGGEVTPSGMDEYEINAAKMRAEANAPPTPPTPMTNEQWNKATYGLSGGIGPRLASRTPAGASTAGSPGPSTSPDTSPTPSNPVQSIDIGPSTSFDTMRPTWDVSQKNPISDTDEYLRQLTTMYSRAEGGVVVPPEDEMDRLRRIKRLGPYDPEGDAIARMRVSEQPFQPSTPEGTELAAREKWNTPGNPETMLATARENLDPGVSSIIPGFQRSYYDVHPEERVADQAAYANKEAIDSANKTLETVKNRAQGFGLSMNPKIAATERAQAVQLLPGLTASAEKLAASEAGIRERIFRDTLLPTTKPIAPHLVQQADGSYVWATPGGLMPAGIMGKTTEPRMGAPHPNTTKGFTLTSDPKTGQTLAIGPDGKSEPYDPQKHGEREVPGVASDEDASMYARKIVNREMTPSQLRLVVQPFGAAGGQTKGKIWKAIEAMDPHFNLKLAEAEYAADSKALNGLSTLFTTASVAMGAARNHAAQIIGDPAKGITGIADQVDKTGSATLNRWFMAGKKAAVGDEAMRALDVKLKAFDTEFARYLRSMTQSGQMAKGEADEWTNLINSAQSAPDLKAGIKAALELMNGKDASFQEQFTRLKDELKGNTPPPGGAGGHTVVERRKSADGRTLVKYSDGTIGEEGK